MARERERQLIYQTAELAAKAVAYNVDGAYECYRLADIDRAIRDLDVAVEAICDLYQRLGEYPPWRRG